MATPFHVDLPHRLGREEARRRIAGGVGRLQGFLPGGADVRHEWTDDRLDLQVAVLGQAIDARVSVEEQVVRVELVLPPALGFFTRAIEAAVKKGGAELLEDRNTRRS